ncbi:MAG: extracellular solute-binding protein [Desulfovibrio sp.]
MKKIILALLLLATFSGSALADNGKLYLYIWSEYIPDEVVENFTKETGIDVHLSTYDSNEAMFAKLKLSGEGYDLVVPTSDYVSLMRKQSMLLPLDKALLPNLANMGDRFTNLPFDPENKYSVPYMWGSTGVAANRAALGDISIQSYKDFWNPALEDKILLPNEPREIFAMALKIKGYSVNDTNPEHIAEAYEMLKTLIPRVRIFDSDSPKQALLAGEVAVGVVWNGEAFIANQENSEIEYIYPAEGFTLWMDSMCIPAGAKNIKEAHAFLNYLMRPDVAAHISTEMGYSTPNAKAMELIAESVRKNPIVYPPDHVIEKGEFLEDIGETTKLYDKYWVKLKTQ